MRRMTAHVRTPLRIGLVGAGMISHHHLVAWQRCRRAEVVAIADPDAAAAQKRALEFAIPETFPAAADLLDAVAPDAVDIAAPMEHHAPICRLAAARGVSIICQKPLCPTYREARALVDEIGDRVRFMVHENWRFRPHYRRIRSWLDAGRIGTPRAFTMEVLSSGLLPDRADAPPPALRRQPFFACMPRLAVLESLIHQLDTLRFLLGELSVAGALLARISDRVVGEDTAMVLLESRGGAIGTLSGSMSVPGLPPRSGDLLRLIGDRATITFRDWMLSCSEDESVERFEPDAAYQAAFDAVIEQFVEGLCSGAPVETSARENLATLALVEDVYRRAE
jgi:predicted dehydrogenase